MVPPAYHAMHKPYSLIPDDLQRFLAHTRKFSANFKKSETGGVSLISAKEVRLGWLYVAPSSTRRDPNRNSDGCYYVAAVNLIKKCKNYSPYGILVYLPIEGLYATWDCDHAVLYAFPKVTWKDIVADPLQFTEYQWNPSSTQVELKLWERYEFKTTEERHPC